MAAGAIQTGGDTASVHGARARHGERPKMALGERWGAVIGYLFVVYRRTWQGSIIGRFLMPLLFLLSMGLGLGELVDREAGGVGGVSYLEFLVPAIIAVQAMWVALGESTYPVLGYIKWNRHYHAMLATPLTVKDIVSAHLLSIAGHITMATATFMVVAAFFGSFASWTVVLALPVGVLTGMAFAAPILAFSATQDGDSGFNILFRFVVTPLMLFSGTFFPVEQLPGWLQPLAWVTPLWHGVEASRGASLGEVDAMAFAGHVLVLVAYIGVGWLWAQRTFTRRLVV